MSNEDVHPTTISQQQAHGELLLATVSMVGDQEDFHIWRARRNQWVQETTAALHACADAGGARGFRGIAGVRTPHSSWRVALPEEAKAVRAAVRWLGDAPPSGTRRFAVIAAGGEALPS